jgi:hypothetical protein
MRAASLVVTDRRWAATLSAAALGFGLFIGVAIGPGAEGGLATPAAQIVEVPDSGGERQVSAGGEAPVVPAPAEAPVAEEPAQAPPGAAFPSSSPTSEPVDTAPVETAPSSGPTKPAAEPAPEDEEKGQIMEGVVIHANPAAGSYTLTIKGGELVAVHAPKLPAPGVKLSVPVRQLANGTFAEDQKPKREGRASGASLTGTVTSLSSNSAAPGYTVSGRGASVPVSVVPEPSGAVPPPPPVGSFVTVDAAIEKPAAGAPSPAPQAPLCQAPMLAPPSPAPAALRQRTLKVENVEPSTYLELAAVFSGLCSDRPALLLSADDARDGGSDLLMGLPTGIDPGGLRPGDSVLASAEVGADGSMTLTGIVSDEGIRGADDASSAQGDLARR